jgi:bifunctional DNA-binding transcriptional regulator/antitoxin component of YhaV-PrlF toxin-antitoxin module
MKLTPGTKMIIIQEGDNILLKPIKAPDMSQFERLIALGDKTRKELNLKKSDIKEAIDSIRKK